jgi:hypothetical protein
MLTLESSRINNRAIARMRERGGLLRSVGNVHARGGRMIRGVASTSALDRHGARLWPYGLEVALPCPVLWKHQGDEIGQVTSIEVFDECVVASAALNMGRQLRRVSGAHSTAPNSLSVLDSNRCA